MSKDKNIKKELKEWAISLAVVLVVLFVVKNFVVGTLIVKGISMEPNYKHGNILIVDKFTYNFKEPERGDVIVSPYSDYDDELIIKRIIALPGEEIDFEETEDGFEILIDGEVLEEKYLDKMTGYVGDNEYPFEVPEGEYFVMGDNRDNSTDSRWQDIGTIEKEDIIGKAAFKVWPLK